MRRLAMMTGMAMVLAGCVPGGRPEAGGVARESIRYETGPCFGRCPVFAVTVKPDGTGVFEGQRFTAVTGTRTFTLSDAQYAAFAQALAPYRPAQGSVRYAPGEKNCPNAPTDMPSVKVGWSGGGQRDLSFYYGCRRDNPALADALGNAPDLLPIQALIGERP